MSDRMRGEECGVVAVLHGDGDAIPAALLGLHALQHRGQESAGLAWRCGPTERLDLHRGMGLVAQVFARPPALMAGPAAIGHTRYSTFGSSRLENAQPFVVAGPHGEVALAHNGHLLDVNPLARLLQELNATVPAATDSAVLAAAIAHAPGADWAERIGWALERVTGSYGLTILTSEGLYAARDPLGNRPLCLGRLPGGWMAASESCAFLTAGADYLREVAPGEIVRLDPAGPRTVGWTTPRAGARAAAFCSFEYIYLARADSRFGERTVYAARQEMGRLLAAEHPVEADLVAGVPDSGNAAALGYAAAVGIPFGEALIKNRYIGRTFIHPGVAARGRALALKFTPLATVVAGKRLVLVDDSLVRGATMHALVSLLKGAGAAEVHLRIASPPVRCPCFFGVDIPTPGELIAHDVDDPAEICRQIGADSLGYLSLAALAAATGASPDGASLCTGCFTGRYPVALPWLAAPDIAPLQPAAIATPQAVG